MKEFKEKQAQAAFEQLQKLREEAEKAGDAAQSVLRAIEPTAQSVLQKLGIGADGKLPDGIWDKWPAQDRLDTRARLQGMLDALGAAIAEIDEPRDSASIMYRAHASNPWIYGLVIGSVVVVALVIWGIYQYWDSATSAKATEEQVLRMVILMGALGGAIHWMSSLVNYIGNGNLFRRWIPYYVLAPFQGAALAMLVYLLLRVGVLAPPPSGTQAVGPAQSLNLLGLYAFAGLTGLFAKQAIEMLRDVFAVVFKKIEAKDASSAAKPPAPGAGKSSESQSAVGTGSTK